MAEAPPSPAPTPVTRSPSDSITLNDKRATRALLWALKPLSNLRRPVPLPSLTAFLMVVLDEGRGVNEYARAVGIHRAAMSRNLHAIGDRARNGGPGLGLVIGSATPRPSGSKPGLFNTQRPFNRQRDLSSTCEMSPTIGSESQGGTRDIEKPVPTISAAAWRENTGGDS